MKIIFLEGLPGVGKTTMLNAIKKLNIKDMFVVDEVINDNILNKKLLNETEFIKNEDMKLNKYSKGTIIIDRGPISLFSYSQAKSIIDNSYNLTEAKKWFDKTKTILKNSKVIYLTNNGKNYSLTVRDDLSPYGTIDNQKLLETISLYNIKKYCNDSIVLEYYKKNMEEIINEIIN